MKLLQNPYVVGVLAVGAGLLVFRNALGPVWQKVRPRRPAPSQTAAVASQPPAKVESTTAAPTPSSKTPRLEQETKIDFSEVGWKLNGSPRRDPFQITALGNLTNRFYPAAWEVLNLTAIWRQTGSNLAVINHKVLAEGDTILTSTNRAPAVIGDNGLKFTVESIDTDLVWLNGPSGREALEFRSVLSSQAKPSAALTNAVQADRATAMR